MPRPNFQPLPNTTTSFLTQLESIDAPIVLLNVFEVPDDHHDAFLAYWQKDAAFMKSQPGMLSAQLHRGIAGSNSYVNVAQWESAAALSRAFHNPEFQKGLEQCPAGVTAYPLVLKKVAIPGVCVA